MIVVITTVRIFNSDIHDCFSKVTNNSMGVMLSLDNPFDPKVQKDQIFEIDRYM